MTFNFSSAAKWFILKKRRARVLLMILAGVCVIALMGGCSKEPEADNNIAPPTTSTSEVTTTPDISEEKAIEIAKQALVPEYLKSDKMLENFEIHASLTTQIENATWIVDVSKPIDLSVQDVSSPEEILAKGWDNKYVLTINSKTGEVIDINVIHYDMPTPTSAQ